MSALASLCVFCGSRGGTRPAYEETARLLGRTLAARRIRLVYGGGSIGLMGIVMQSVLDNGGEVIGVIPEFLTRREVGNPDLTELVVVDSMHARKQRMFELSDAFVALPGGIGTLDEVVEVISWQQLRLHRKPIAFLDVADYWNGFRTLMDRAVDEGFAEPAIRDLYTLVDDVDALLTVLDEQVGGRWPDSSRL